MIKRFGLFMGPERLWALFFLFALTGLGNLVLNVIVDDNDWARSAQSALVIIFLIGSALIVGSRLDPFERGRWAGILAPALGAIVLSMIVAPDFLPLALGASAGWIGAGLFIFRPRGPMAYQQAVKQFRKNDFAGAVKTLTELIKTEPEQAQHYRFRAEIYRVWGKLDRARRDYEKMTTVEPDNAVAFNGLAEVHLQAGAYDSARQAAETALDLAPGEWVAAYNLGMIEDRLRLNEQAVTHLKQAIQAKPPDSRHKLLIHFYLARAQARLGDHDAAAAAINKMRRFRGGLNEWQVLLQSDQAQTLRDVIEEDIRTIEALINEEISIEDLTD